MLGDSDADLPPDVAVDLDLASLDLGRSSAPRAGGAGRGPAMGRRPAVERWRRQCVRPSPSEMICLMQKRGKTVISPSQIYENK